MREVLPSERNLPEAGGELDDYLGFLVEIYHLLGALDAPANVMDQAYAAFELDPLPYKSILTKETFDWIGRMEGPLAYVDRTAGRLLRKVTGK